jgi:signal transduction histidine kinase
MTEQNHKIHLERINQLMQKQKPSSFISLVLACILYSGYYDRTEQIVHSWFGLQILTVVIRSIYLQLTFKKGVLVEEFKKADKYELHYSILVSMTCALWGMSLYVFLPYTKVEFIPLLCGMFFGVLIGGVSRTDSSFRLSKAYIFGYLVPFFIFTFVDPTKASLLLALCTLIFGLFLFFSLKKQYLAYLNMARLLDDNQKMAEELKGKLELEKQLQKEKALNFQNAKLASIGELAAGVAHEINNPLSIATGYLMTIEKDPSFELPEKHAAKIEKIQVAHVRIKNIVRGLKNFSRKDEEEHVLFSLSEILEESVLFVQEIYSKQGIQIDADFEKDLHISGHRGEVQQVIMNLFSNARDAVLDNLGDKKIEVKLYSVDDEVFLTIRDNGCGIQNEVKEQIFDPFFTTKGVNKGTGIGLSITHKIIKEHGGKIEVQSERNKYTIFQLIFPIAEVAEDTSSKAS